MEWYRKKINEIIENLNTSLSGLSSENAQLRLREHGPNELKETKKRPLIFMFLEQFKDFMILVLIAAAVISGILGDVTDTIVIIIIVILNAVIGFVQKYRAEKAMEALKKMASPTALVLRDGTPSRISASELVPGDVVILEAGNAVPADVRLVEAAQLKIDEAALTGESVPVEKFTDELDEEHLSIGDRKNMAYKDTFVSYGRGAGIVVATGMDTELGRIAAMLQEGEQVQTPLQKRLAKFGQKLGIVVLVLCVVFFGIGITRGEPLLLMLLTAISLAVAAIPEALPAVITISLAIGAKKLVKQNALIRNLPAVETLGSITYICSDKTGTLTLNKMTVEEICAGYNRVRTSDLIAEGQDNPVHYLLAALALNNDAQMDAEGKIIGDPTEIALYNIAKDKGFERNRMEQQYPRLAEIPFDSERKTMTTFHGWTKGFVSFTKGALEPLLEKSDTVLTSDGIKPIDAREYEKINEEMAANGLRVLCIAMKRWDVLPDNMLPSNIEKGLTVLGLVGMMDPPREEAREAVSLCKAAGIKPVMITGDHPVTARAVAKRIGIMEDDTGVITGRELEKITWPDFLAKVEKIRVYARVAPEQKLKIVKALQEKGQYIAMTGDGVNDAPALKRSDIGIAMGITGTDVSKEAAHMILLDDNFATVVKAVREGRRIFDNIRKFIKYTMTSNSGEILTIFLAPFFGLPIPLLPIHILWINLVTDGLPGLALAAEPAEKDVMKRPPRHPQESIFAHGLGTHIIWVGLLMGLISVFVQAWSIGRGYNWQTMVFTVLCLNQMGHVLAIRSERESLFRQGLLSNKPLLGAFALTFVLQMATIYVPFLNPVFKTVPLAPGELIFTLMLSSGVFIAVEVEKFIKRKFIMP